MSKDEHSKNVGVSGGAFETHECRILKSARAFLVVGMTIRGDQQRLI